MHFQTAGNGSKNRIFTPFGDFYIDVENLFDHVLGNKPTAGENDNTEQSDAAKPFYRPAANVVESEKMFTVSIDLPGVAASDVNIELLDQELKVWGSRTIAGADEGDRVILSRRASGEFENLFRFEPLVDESGVEASFDSGVLTILVPKAAKAVAKKIEIKTVQPDRQDN